MTAPAKCQGSDTVVPLTAKVNTISGKAQCWACSQFVSVVVGFNTTYADHGVE